MLGGRATIIIPEGKLICIAQRIEARECAGETARITPQSRKCSRISFCPSSSHTAIPREIPISLKRCLGPLPRINMSGVRSLSKLIVATALV